MKILLVASEYSPGMIPFAATIANDLANTRHEIHLLSVSRGVLSYLNVIDKDTVHLTNLEYPLSPEKRFFFKFFSLVVYKKIVEIINKSEIKYVHFLTGDFTLASLVFRLKKRASIVYTVHDLIPHETAKEKCLKEKFFDKYIQWGYRKMTNNADILVTCSKEQFHALKKKYTNKQVFFHDFPSLVTKNIIEGSIICPELKNIGKYILFFGRIDVYKGVDLLYKVFIESEVFSDYTLVVAGMGQLYFETKRNGNRVIRIDRHIDEMEVKSLFEQATCVIYPYISATMSGVLTLAYAMRTPVLASDIPFFRDNIEDGRTGILFKNKDEKDLRIKLQKLLFETNLQHMKHNQKEFYEQHYSSNSLKRQMESIYSSLTDKTLE